jgi:hypothetical protein
MTIWFHFSPLIVKYRRLWRTHWIISYPNPDLLSLISHDRPPKYSFFFKSPISFWIRCDPLNEPTPSNSFLFLIYISLFRHLTQSSFRYLTYTSLLYYMSKSFLFWVSCILMLKMLLSWTTTASRGFLKIPYFDVMCNVTCTESYISRQPLPQCPNPSRLQVSNSSISKKKLNFIFNKTILFWDTYCETYSPT